jgi:transcriptional regulator with XRE-family HTH domain
LGHRLGLSFQQIQKYETGANRVSSAMLYRMANLFGINMTYFFADMDSSEEHDGDKAMLAGLKIASFHQRIADPEVREMLYRLTRKLAEPEAPCSD